MMSPNHLHAVRAVVPAVAELPLALVRRIAFEIGGGQIIQRHLEIGLKQFLPTLAQKREQRRLVRDELVQATIEIVGLREPDVCPSRNDP